MEHVKLSLKNISKCYKLYNRSSHRLTELLHPFRKKYHKNFFALKDIDLEIPHGEILGVLGVNGAGKSTLLKILAGVLKSTKGEREVLGTIVGLLELGAGFNPEFTGLS